MAWRTSSYSGPNGNCVALTFLPAAVVVRDSTNPPPAETVAFSRPAFEAFVLAVKQGRFDGDVLRAA
jgi:Domain of unknown function (DUF397)